MADHIPAGQAGAEVTPEMLEVGIRELRQWQEGSEYDYRAFLTRLFLAMLSARPKA